MSSYVCSFHLEAPVVAPIWTDTCFCFTGSYECRLQPGEVWTGEVAMRWHDKYWEIPLFDRGPQPNSLADPMPGYEKLERERKMPVMPPRQAQDSKRMPSFDQQLSV